MRAVPRPFGSLAGRCAIVTGATSGIGSEIAGTLGSWGCRIVLVGRDPLRVQAAVRRCSDRGIDARGVSADLGDTRATLRLAKELCVDYPRLDLLVNNAGGLFSRWERTDSGVERTWGVNVLAPFVLTEVLLPSLATSGAGRVVNVASSAHRLGRLHRADLELADHYGGWAAYAQSKLALILLTSEAARRHSSLPVTFNACHPGFVRSRFAHERSSPTEILIRLAQSTVAISARRGAKTPLYLAASTEVDAVSGGYFVRGRERAPSLRARDRDAAGWLWEDCVRRVHEVSLRDRY
ncbi:MAG: SDR family NAD(P)-dependent oxidoreductase [Thermoplasmata archaeon]